MGKSHEIYTKIYMKMFKISSMLLVAVQKQYIQQLIKLFVNSCKQKLLIPQIFIHTLNTTYVCLLQLLFFAVELLFSSNKTPETLKMMTIRFICLILMSHWLLKGHSNSKMDQTWKCCQSAPSQKAKNNKARCQVVDSTPHHRFCLNRIDYTVLTIL